MAAFNGQLRSNEIFAALYNMIISQQVFADNVYDTKSTLADMSRVDGSMYGDTKLYYATDVLKSVPWGNDAEAANLLALHRPEAPECQAIHLDQFRQISLTVDNYLSKRAWGTEGSFSSFNSVMLGWIRDTKRVYDSTLFNSYIGTAASTVGKQTKVITLPAEPDGSEVDLEAYNRIVAQTIAEETANLIVDLEDVSREYNDYGNLRSYDVNDLVFVWNSEQVNKIKKVDLPTIFHKDELIDKFAQHTLPARYFGNVNKTGGTTSGANITVRSLVEADYGNVHVFPGELLPGGVSYSANMTYTEDPSIVFKVYHKRSVPFMSAFEVGTSFLTWGYNTLEYLKNYPFITVKVTNAS